MKLRARVLEALAAHGIVPAPGEEVDALRDRLNDRYLDEVRELRACQRAGEIAIRDYATHAQALKERYPLLGLPAELWVE